MASQQIKTKTIKLSNGQEMPLFGLGTYKTTNEQEMTNLIRTALDVGYRLIDTAWFYQNEKMIGDSLKIIFSEGKYKREDIFIVTKILPFNTNTEETVRKQLKDLQIDYLDLLIQHWTFAPPKDNYEWNHKPLHIQWAELEDLQNKGLTKSLGVSNFNTQILVDLLSYCKIKPVINQIELHIFNQQPRLVQFLQKIKIYPVAYSPMAKYFDVVHNETLKRIADSYKVPISQVMLQFLISQGIAVIPKTEKPERLAENLNSLNLKLKNEDIEELKKLDNRTKVVDVQANEQFFKGIPIFD